MRTLRKRLRSRPHPSCLHADRRARRRQNDDRAHPRARLQLRTAGRRRAARDRPSRRSTWRSSACIARRSSIRGMSTCSRWTPPRTPASTTCARSSTAPAIARSMARDQGLHHRRSSHALEGRVQRAVEDAGRAAAACEVHLRHDRNRQGAGDGALALPALRSAPHRRRDAGRASAQHLRGGEASRSTRRRSP